MRLHCARESPEKLVNCSLFQKMGLGPRCLMYNEAPSDTVKPLFVVKGWPAGLYSFFQLTFFFDSLPCGFTLQCQWYCHCYQWPICSPLFWGSVFNRGEHRLGDQRAWVQTVALPLTSSVTSLCLSTLVFGKGADHDDSPYLVRIKRVKTHRAVRTLPGTQGLHKHWWWSSHKASHQYLIPLTSLCLNISPPLASRIPSSLSFWLHPVACGT